MTKSDTTTIHNYYTVGNTGWTMDMYHIKLGDDEINSGDKKVAYIGTASATIQLPAAVMANIVKKLEKILPGI